MANPNLISIDLAKNVFQVCGVTKANKVIFNSRLSRHELATFMMNQPQTTIAMEACYSSHYWAREFESMGHTVNLIPAQHVTPFVRGNKSDRNDSLAIAEAARRPHMRCVPIKSTEQQDIQALHRIRERHISQRTALINQTRGLLSEYGLIAPRGHKAFCQLLHSIHDNRECQLSPMMRTHLRLVADEYYAHADRIDELDQSLEQIAKKNPLCQLLLSIPGIGVINATTIYSAIGNGNQFKNAREFAVWLGLTPKQASSGEKSSSAGITKRGNRYLRKQLVHGARSLIFRCKQKTDSLSQWANQLIARRGIAKACVAMAARLARTAWILLHKGEHYKTL